MPIREFTRAQLADLGVPLDDPCDVEYSETVLADELVTTLKYSAQRRCVFRADDGKVFAVTYEAQLDTGDYEGGPPPDDYGWFGDTVRAEEVESRFVCVQRWLPVADLPATAPDRETRSVLEHLIEMYEECGAPTGVARDWAAEWLDTHADELKAMFRDDADE